MQHKSGSRGKGRVGENGKEGRKQQDAASYFSVFALSSPFAKIRDIKSAWWLDFL